MVYFLYMGTLFQGFKQFILRGNVVDLAVGVMIGASFNAVVSGLVKDIFTPLIAAIIGQPDFSTLAITIHRSSILYGDFLNALISFLITAVAIYFFIVLPINTLTAKMRFQKPVDSTTKKCSHCLSEIPVAATKCAYCTADL